jgi:hypothetical protein
MMSLAQLDDDSVQQIRKTAEDPPRVSVIDVVAVATGMSSNVASNAVQRLKETYPEVTRGWCNFKCSISGVGS